MAVVTAAEAAQLVRAYNHEQNNTRMMPPMLNRLSVLMKEESFPICNVGPWPHYPERGPLRVFIPAYDAALDTEKRGYAASERMPTVRAEAKVVSESEFGLIWDDGHMVANDLIGVGTGHHPANSLIRFGVFVPKDFEPTKEEIAVARQALLKFRDELIEEARIAHDKGPQERQAVITDRHMWAGRTAGLDEAWMHKTHTQDAVPCEMCGKRNPQGIAKCQCGNILDFELYKRIVARQNEQLAEVEPAKSVKK